MLFFSRIMQFFGFEKIKEAVRLRVRLRRPKTPEPSNKVASVNDTPIEYLIADPTLPQLRKQVISPSFPPEPIVIKQYRGGGFERGTAEALSANCLVTISNTLDYMRRQTDRPFGKWSATKALNIIPRAGVDINAFYNRKSLQFFYASVKEGETIFTAESSDIVAHELGHAILDAYRPEMWNPAFLEVDSFHEAFADFTAMMHMLSYDEVLNYVIQETGGNLRQSNCVSRVAEQMGQVIFGLAGPAGGRDANALRDAINGFKYVDPATLPQKAPPDQLAGECHNFSRIFTGALYDILVMIYEDACSGGDTPVAALKHARDQICQYVLKAIQNCPVNAKFYESMATTILWADVVSNARRYHDRMWEIFFARNLVKSVVYAMADLSCDTDDRIVQLPGVRTIRISEEGVSALSAEHNPLYDVFVEAPCQKTYLFDDDKHFYDVISTDDEETVAAVQSMLDYLHATGSVGDSPDMPFRIQDGKLVRNFIK